MNEDPKDTVSFQNVNFDDIIKERKTKRKLDAEEKRRVDLQRIANMKSVTGIDPLQRFPKELWNKIFYELDPDDRANVWHVHPTFRDIMESRRIQDILLPQVLKLETFQCYVKYMHGNIILPDFNYEPLRGVSKYIRNAFDHVTEEKVFQRIRESEASSEFGGTVSLSLGSSAERLLLNRLLSSFESDQENPGKRYFPRDLYISFTDLDVDNEDGEDISEVINSFKTNLISLLGVIGNQILHLRFEFGNPETDNIDFSPLRVYALFQQLICLMPNLRWLEVEIMRDNDFDPVGEGVKAILREHPFPRLASLERLTCHGPFSMGGDVEVFNTYWTVIEANPHLKMLDLDELDGYRFEDLPDHLIKAFPLTSFRPCGAGLFEGLTLQDIQHIVNFNWPLKIINLSLDYSKTGTKSSSIMPVLQFLEKFPTLETVKLKDLTGFRFGKDDTFEYLKLPNLKDLEIDLSDPEITCEGNIHFFFSLEFLLHCEKLKTLKWEMRLVDDSELRKFCKKHENGKTVDFRAGMTVLYESNIWDVFPSLDTAKVVIIKDPMNTCCRTYPLSCVQEYRRSSRRGMSMRKFLKSHGCSRGNSLQNCVVLQE